MPRNCQEEPGANAPGTEQRRAVLHVGTINKENGNAFGAAVVKIGRDTTLLFAL